MRLITANTAGSIQAADTIIHGRKRGARTGPQYRPRLGTRNINQRGMTVRVQTPAARVFFIVRHLTQR